MDQATVKMICWIIITLVLVVALLAEPGRWSL